MLNQQPQLNECPLNTLPVHPHLWSLYRFYQNWKTRDESTLFFSCAHQHCAKTVNQTGFYCLTGPLMHHRRKVKEKKTDKNNTDLQRIHRFAFRELFLNSDISAFPCASQAKESLPWQHLLKGYFYNKPCRHVCCKSIYTTRDVLTAQTTLYLPQPYKATLKTLLYFHTWESANGSLASTGETTT